MERAILLVDDDPDDEVLTVRALKAHRVTDDIVVVRDGEAALEYPLSAGSHGGRVAKAPAVVLLNLKLPRLDGLDVLQRLREDERTRCLPVVILTSSDEERDMVRSYRLGANSYVRKPVNFVQFSNAMRQLGQYWLHCNETPRRAG